MKGQLYSWGKGPATGFDVADVITTPRQALVLGGEVRRNVWRQLREECLVPFSQLQVALFARKEASNKEPKMVQSFGRCCSRG